MKPERRKIWCVDEQLQMGLCRRLLVYSCATWLAIFAVPICSRMLFTELPFSQLATELVSDFWFPMMMSLLVAPVLLWDSIRFTHRIAGPIHRINRQVKQLADRESVQPIKLRKNDFCHELANDLNRVAEVYGQQTENGHVEIVEASVELQES